MLINLDVNMLFSTSTLQFYFFYKTIILYVMALFNVKYFIENKILN